MPDDPASASEANLSRADVVALVGDADPAIVSRILSYVASRNDFERARAWLERGGESVPDGEAEREQVRGLAELLATARTLAGR